MRWFILVLLTAIILLFFFTFIVEKNVTVYLEHVSSDSIEDKIKTHKERNEANRLRGKLEYKTKEMRNALKLLGIRKKRNPSAEEKRRVICDILTYIDSSFRYRPEYREYINASTTLIEGQGDCVDFTILFMSLAATAGIPKENLRAIKAYGNYSGIPAHHMYPEVRFTLSNKVLWLPIEVTKNVKTNKLYNTGNFCKHLTRDFGNIRRHYWFGFDDVGVFSQPTEAKKNISISWLEYRDFYSKCYCN